MCLKLAQPAPDAPVVVCVGGVATVVGTTTGAAVVVVTGAGGGAACVVVGAGGGVEVVPLPVDVRVTVVVEVLDPVEEPEVEPVFEEPVELEDPDEPVEEGVPDPPDVPELVVREVEGVPTEELAALFAAARVDAAIDAAVALAFCAVLVRDETIRRSLASVALRRFNVLALSAAWRDTYAGTVVVVAGTVAPTNEFASPVPTMATEVTTTVGNTRRRNLEGSSVREVRARFAARR